MANLGFYSRHLTEEEVQGITATTRRLILANTQADAGDDSSAGDLNLIKAESILNRLLLCGNYENIIRNIFKYLNATQLACLQKTCESWDQFIQDQVWGDGRSLARLRTYWGTYMPKCFVISHNRQIITMAVTPGYIACGVEKTGQVVIYNRAALYDVQTAPCNNCPVMPADWVQVTREGHSVTSVDMDGELMVTGTSDGAVAVYSLLTGELLERLSQASSMVYQVRLVGSRVVVTMGAKVTVHRLTLQAQRGLGSRLTHLLGGHTREVLCVDCEGDVVVSGGRDTTVLVHRLGGDNVASLEHTLTGHTLKVRAVAIHGDYAVSGSWDRTARLWSLATGQCARVLKHEVQVRCLALDGHRILTGDVEGYVYAWDLDNCLDPGCGPEKLCLRAHNAMDPDLYCKDSEKIVYSVHLEPAAMVQVAGGTGRIVVSDFWDYDGPDEFQLESYGPNV